MFNKNNLFIKRNNFLNPNYTFDNFIINNGNSFAFAAAKLVVKTVIETNKSSFNPLFIYGDSGLGKTHILHAIGNEIIQAKPNTKILYLTSEKFINELVNFKKDNINNFKNIDLLLVDDFQFILENILWKKKLQKKCFNIIYKLCQNKKQIIISCDKSLNDIYLLEKNLRIILNSGLLVDISKPDNVHNLFELL